jgi:hypothetical protein
MKTARRCLLLALALGLLALPAGALAAPPSGQQLSAPVELRKLVRERTDRGGRQPAFHPAFVLKSQNGYWVEVVGSGDNVVIYVVPSRNASNATAYVARGTVTRSRLVASFGKFGRVSMRFRASAQRTRAKPNRDCKGRSRFEDQLGTYVGQFSFRGEGGYVSVKARRAMGQIGGIAPRCRPGRSALRRELATHPSQNGFWGPEEPYLTSSWRHGVGSAHFAAVQEGKQTILIARTEQSHGKFAIFRIALLAASSPQALQVSDALTAARVSPPAPFHGTGTYRAAPDGTVSWTGALSVNFPGFPRYPLTGPPFEALVGTTSEPFFAFF